MSHSFWANFFKMTWTLTQLSRSPLIHLTFWHCLTDFTIWIYEGYLCWNCRCWVQTRIKAVMNAHAALKDAGPLVVVANLMWFGSLTYWSHELLISRFFLKKRGEGQNWVYSLESALEIGENTLWSMFWLLLITLFGRLFFPQMGSGRWDIILCNFPLVQWNMFSLLNNVPFNRCVLWLFEQVVG